MFLEDTKLFNVLSLTLLHHKKKIYCYLYVNISSINQCQTNYNIANVISAAAMRVQVGGNLPKDGFEPTITKLVQLSPIKTLRMKNSKTLKVIQCV